MIKNFLRIILKLAYKTSLYLVIFCYLFTYTVQALSAEQRQVIDGGSNYINVGCELNSASSSEQTGSIYVLGDSLTKGMREAGDLQGKLENHGWEVKEIEATNGFNIELSMPKVDEDESKIAESDRVVIILGTNRDTNFEQKVDSLINKIRGFTDTAQISWVNTANYGVTRGGYSDARVNEIIQNKSESLGYNVIDWETEFANNTSEYPTVGDGLHQTPDGYINRAQWTADQIGDAPVNGSGPSSEAAVADTSSMSLRDKLAQLLMPRVDTEADLDTVTGKKVGGVFVGRDHISELSQKIKDKQGNETKYLVSIDGEGGTVDVPIGSNPPAALEMGSMSDEEVKNIAKEFGQELSDLGVNMDLAPVADVVDNISEGVIKTRSFGNNNQTVIDKAGAFAEGLRESKVLPTFKHFPGHGHATTTRGGSTLADSHLNANAYVQNKSQLLNNDLAPFVELMATSPSAVMVGHLIIPDIDADTPATISSAVITDFLRGELGYDGLVITDDMGDMAPITSRINNFPEAVYRAIKAGNDMALFVGHTDQIDSIIDRLEQAVNNGQLTEDRVDESVRRIQEAKSLATPEVLDECECSTEGGPTGDFSGNNNVEVAYNYFTSQGLSPEQASGIIGNLMQESSPELNPEADNGSHYGIAQWGSRQTYLDAFASATGRQRNDFEMQLEFIWHELTGESSAPNSPNAGAYKSSTYDPIVAVTQTGYDGVVEVADIFEANYEISGGSALENRRNFGKQVFDQYGGGTGGSASSNCGNSTVNGVECPPNIDSLRHPSQEGYYQMPDAPNGEYTFDPGTGPEQRYGSKQLVCVIYTVALAYKTQYGDQSTIDIGDLNASGHHTHYKGVAVDISADGTIAAANDHNGYDQQIEEATIALGKMFVDTGSIKNIWWCPPDAPNNDDADGVTQVAIREYAASKDTPITIQCEPGHANHFHVDIADEYIIPGSFTP